MKLATAQDFPIPGQGGLSPLVGIRSNIGVIDTVINIINALLVLAAIAAVVYIIISGVRYFASQGDETAVSQAKRSLLFGIIHLLLYCLWRLVNMAHTF